MGGEIAGGGGVDPRGGVVGDAHRRLGFDSGCENCTAETLDVAFFFTTLLLDTLKAELEAQGVDPADSRGIAISNIQAEIALQVVNANNAFENSGLETRVVRIADVPLLWDEVTSDVLGSFADPSSGVGAQAAGARNDLGARPVRPHEPRRTDWPAIRRRRSAMRCGGRIGTRTTPVLRNRRSATWSTTGSTAPPSRCCSV